MSNESKSASNTKNFMLYLVQELNPILYDTTIKPQIVKETDWTFTNNKLSDGMLMTVSALF